MDTLITTAVADAHGVVTIHNLPAGEKVEIIVLSAPQRSNKKYALRGTQCSYDFPFEPAIPDDEWDSIA